MLRKIIFTTTCLIASASMYAQDSTKTNDKLSINGSLDGYYKYDFAKNPKNGLTSFTQSTNRFEIGMASILLQYKTKKTQIVLDLGWGKRDRNFAYTDSGITASIKQVFINYNPINNLCITAGSWTTHIGYELLDAYQNSNYSMSYLFSTGPFSHTGIKATYTWQKHQIMLGVANPTDYRYIANNVLNKKSIIAQYHYSNKSLNIYLNYVGGKLIDSCKQKQIDLVTCYRINPTWQLAVNSTIGFKNNYTNSHYTNDKTWWGVATYLKANITNKAAIALREEYFNDKNKLTSIPIDGNVVSSTLSLNYNINEHLKIIPELRADAASVDIFKNKNNASCKTNSQALVALTYQF